MCFQSFNVDSTTPVSRPRSGNTGGVGYHQKPSYSRSASGGLVIGGPHTNYAQPHPAHHPAASGTNFKLKFTNEQI